MSRANNPAVFLNSASEASIQRAICDYLWYSGWVVVETSQPAQVVGGIVGCPDVIAWKRMDVALEHAAGITATVTLLIECKAHRGRMRESQREFYMRISPHLGPTLRYCVARSIDDVIKVISVIETQGGQS